MKKKVIFGVGIFIILILVIVFLCVKFDMFTLFSAKSDLEKSNSKEVISQSNENINSIINNVNLIDIKDEFSQEEAINQGCFVITGDKVYNEDVLYKFIENTGINSKNRIPDKIRIVVYNLNNEPKIYDLEYRNLNEEYIDDENRKTNKTGYRLITDISRVHTYENHMNYNQHMQIQQIKINEDIPGDIYGINIVKYKDINASIISLLVHKDIANTEQYEKKYEDIEIARYSLINN